ncbi:TatD family hydrolase [uncultured Limosilactobacillus sp.]|uniref:TatD family hydrolase n=1 Tax=uncultured Limosilactobacillus sp. TaxID=2837629 RepID=UPI0025DBACE2|nr:TatD family hydrolase [uncultured Limosilactobacillus sp.]
MNDQVIPLNIYDSHTHLNDDCFYDDVPAYLARAKHYGVNQMNMVGSNQLLNERAVQLAHRYPQLRAIVGWHPEDAKDYDQQARVTLQEQLKAPLVVGIGEIGLDYHWDTSPKTVQQRVFEEQLDLARQYQLPVSIHCREALADTYQILKDNHVGDFGGVMHSFAGDARWARKFLDLGMNLSFSGVVSFHKATEVHEAARVTPLDRLMVETDAPYLTPMPYRGKQNEPAFTYYTVLALSQLLDQSPETIAQASYRNADQLFKKRVSNEED